ncbi:quinone oxidoreductase family protein [Pantoea ananatis]|uniref:quinone oxidoreductase family protein n=1 Tax=Pantoea ananas TaxID=553 RepID=UPI000CF41216|nr:zinc-binding alcohol dehydrogenase family protein [Pantoea ananatis]PQL02280.1 alcohol dehydrogenase [Pantoea ananatis]
MKAVVLKTWGEPLVYSDVPEPVCGSGEVLVEVVAAPVLSYTNEVFSGQRHYLLDLPAIPGCGAVGKVLETGPDATQLKKGMWVFCDPTVRSRDSALMPDIVLQGWSARGGGGLALQQYHRNGSFAEKIRIPTENALPLGEMALDDARAWCVVNTLLIAYGGLQAGRFEPGETLLVSGATGNFGSSAVAIALAMGAGKVIATGRNTAILQDLVARFGPRVIPVRLTGDEQTDLAACQAAGGFIDMVLDFLPPAAPASAVRTAVMSVRPYGRAVLMGGVGMLGGEPLSLPYPWIMRNLVTIKGQWMYERADSHKLIQLIQQGQLDLHHWTITPFALNDVARAVEHAAQHAGPFQQTVVVPPVQRLA